jgi:hypothetical protein
LINAVSNQPLAVSQYGIPLENAGFKGIDCLVTVLSNGTPPFVFNRRAKGGGLRIWASGHRIIGKP